MGQEASRVYFQLNPMEASWIVVGVFCYEVRAGWTVVEV